MCVELKRVPIGALVAVAILVAPAGADARPGPPSGATVDRRTEAFLDHHPGRRSPTIAPELAARHSARTRGPLDGRRMVSLYGAPQLEKTALGERSPRRAAAKITDQARPYGRLDRLQVVPAFDLVAVIATSNRGPDGLYRTRQPDRVIATYLDRVRRFGGRLVLDIQPGRSTVRAEVRALKPWLTEPDVDVAIDPEWNVGPHGVPGGPRGSIEAKRINAVSRDLAEIVARHDLPPKALIVHHFRRTNIKHRGRLVELNRVALDLSFDGSGSLEAKRAGYRYLASRRISNGISLFYDRDSPLMTPRQVLGLDPEALYVMYQ